MTSRDATVPSWMSRIPVRLLLFAIVAVSAFALGFLTFGVTASRILVQRYGYYIISLTFAWAVFAWYKAGRSVLGAPRKISPREWWQATGLIFVCALVGVLTTPINYKILYDEMVLQATASNLHLYREVSTVVRAYTVDGVFVPLDSYLDKRPYFFTYLVSLLHDLSGYREANAFALNMALLPVVLAQIYALARGIAGHVGAIIAVLSLGTLSTIVHSATGAGMEMLNLTMILLVMQLAVFYLERPDETRLAALLLAAVLLAQTRYESSLYVIPVAIIAVEGWRRAGRTVMPIAAIFAPALLVPYAVHNTYLSGTPSLWELRDNAQTRFGAEHIIPNLQHAGRFFFNTSTASTNSLWLSCAGLTALLTAAVVLWRRRKGWREAPPAAPIVTLFGVVVAANLALLMCYYWGQLDDPTVTRLSLPFSMLLAICIGYGVHCLTTRLRYVGWIAAGAAVLAYLWSGVIANQQHTRMNTLGLELEWEAAFVEKLPPGERLILSNKSALPWMIRRISAVSIDHARRRVDALRFQLKNQTFREVLVCQTYQPTDAAGKYQLNPTDRLPDWFVLEPVVERRFGTRLDRISRLVEIGSAPSPAAGVK